MLTWTRHRSDRKTDPEISRSELRPEFSRGTHNLPLCTGLVLAVGFQIPEHPVERVLVRVVILPIAEIRDEVFADLSRAVDSPVRIEEPPVLDAVERHDGDWEQHLAFLLFLSDADVRDLGFHPGAAHAGV